MTRQDMRYARERFVRQWYVRHRIEVAQSFEDATKACFKAAVAKGLYSPKTYFIDTNVGNLLIEARGF